MGDAEAASAHVLVLLASYNGAPWIESQIRSVLNQTGVRVSLHVRDDDSSDGTRHIVAGMCQSDSRVALSPDHSRMGTAASNFFALILRAPIDSHDYVALCDQDDDWNADKLLSAVTQLSRHRADGYSAAVEAIWPDGRRKVLVQSPVARAADYLFEGAGQGCTFVLSMSLFSRLQATLICHQSLLRRVHYHDWTIYALARASGAAWYFDGDVRMQYRQHAGNDTGARASLGGVKRRLSLIWNGWYCRQVACITAIVLAAHPEDSSAARWRELSHTDNVLGRCRRIGFAWNRGRRDWSNRLVQVFAIACGRL